MGHRGDEQIQTSPGACNEVPVVMAALVTEGRTWQWYRDHLGQGRGGRGSGEGHAEPTGARGPVGWAHHLLLVGCYFLPADALLSPLCKGQYACTSPFMVGKRLPCPLTAYLCSPHDLMGWGHQLDSTTATGLPWLASSRSYTALPCATVRARRKHEPCLRLPAVHSASSPASLAWLKYSKLPPCVRSQLY